ncbi:MAG: M24 family metallopeptidase, partial [Pseudomonadales bacterium]|nr:M24 family metallopeptidase [Pseudomonadales bacterium]
MSSELKQKIKAMTEGGKLIRDIKLELRDFSTLGRRFIEIEDRAQELIKKVGAKPSFSMEPGYKWALCINKNAGMVHGIPDEKIIEDGDLISIDMGLVWEGYHVDTSVSFVVGTSTPEKNDFLRAGEKALAKAIDQAWPGNSVYDISKAIEKTIKSFGYNPSFQLTGHGIGKKLHEQPLIPCITSRQD